MADCAARQCELEFHFPLEKLLGFHMIEAIAMRQFKYVTAENSVQELELCMTFV